jgi:hypothetical protein
MARNNVQQVWAINSCQIPDTGNQPIILMVLNFLKKFAIKKGR